MLPNNDKPPPMMPDPQAGAGAAAAAPPAKPKRIRRAPVNLTSPAPAAMAAPALTGDYSPSASLLPVWLWEERPQLPIGVLIELIMADPTVIMGLLAFKGPMARVQFLAEGSSAEAVAFAQTQVENLWQHSEKILRCVEWGWSANEVLYQEDANSPGGWTICGLKDFYPLDARVVTQGGKYAGIDITTGGNARMSDPAKGSPPTLPGVTGLWATHDARFGAWYGRSRALRAWKPWQALNLRAKGLYASRRLAAFKYGFQGETAHVPEPNTVYQDGQYAGRTRIDVVQELLELYSAGGVRALPAAKNGEKLVTIDPPVVLGEPTVINTAIKSEEKLILLALGVPPETIETEHGSLGSGGRDIPMQVLYSGINSVASDVGSQAVERLILPLTALHYGVTDTTVKVLPLEVPKDEKASPGGMPGFPGQKPDPFDQTKPPGDQSGPEREATDQFSRRLAEKGAASLSLSAVQRDVHAGRVSRAAGIRRLSFDLGLSAKRAAELLPG